MTTTTHEQTIIRDASPHDLVPQLPQAKTEPLTAKGSLTERYTASPDERVRAWVWVTPGVKHAVDDVTGLPV